MTSIRIRYKSPKGNGIMTFDGSATVENLALQLFCELGTESYEVRYGWPPKPLDFSAKHISLVSLNMNGETLTIVMDQPPADTTVASDPGSASQDKKKKANTKTEISKKEQSNDVGDVVIPYSDREGALVLRVMPDDNSCLFTAFGGVIHKENASAELRREVAGAILSNPRTYNEVVLEMSPSRYCELIQHPDRWGGAIELGILSDLYNMEICSVDVKTGRVDRYGENKSLRCILCYSGIHYDRIAFSYCPPPYTSTDLPVEADVTTWPTEDDDILQKAVQLSRKLKEMNYFTDTTNFLVKCDTPGCNWIGEGAAKAQEHMKQSGHTKLSEMEIK